jgi:hypothetical protein
MTIRPVFFKAGLVSFILFSVTAFAQDKPPGWQNPDIGLTLDLTADSDDALDGWSGQGLKFRGAELIISSNIDPYASLEINTMVSQTGAELHEAFALFHSVPGNLKMKGGMMLANFGRWNRFHVHFMPFTSEPALYHEYAGGMLALSGVEASWMIPADFFAELTLSGYNTIEGHTHDSQPYYDSGELTVEQVAEMIGAVPHGSHYDYNGMHIYDTDDLYAIAGLPAKNNPVLYKGEKKIADFVYGGRFTTSADIGSSVSIDAGASLLYQNKWKSSKRTEQGFPEYYDKLLWGADLVLFWHPPEANKYRNMQIGAELLGSAEWAEVVYPEKKAVKINRHGAIFNADYRHTGNWSLGVFSSIFERNSIKAATDIHNGAYLTYAITHYQYLRLEYSRFDYPDIYDGVNRIRLQYDATIGHHTHGRLR